MHLRVHGATGDLVFQGTAQFEEVVGKAPFSFRGSIGAFNASTGKLVWNFYPTPNNATSGAGEGIWSTPAVDTRLARSVAVHEALGEAQRVQPETGPGPHRVRRPAQDLDGVQGCDGALHHRRWRARMAGEPVTSMEKQFGHDTSSVDASALLFSFFFDRTRHCIGAEKLDPVLVSIQGAERLGRASCNATVTEVCCRSVGSHEECPRLWCVFRRPPSRQ